MGELDDNTNDLDTFVASGRTGRRNALPDLGVENSDPNTLAERFSQMEATGESDGPCCSNANSSTASATNQQQQQQTNSAVTATTGQSSQK